MQDFESSDSSFLGAIRAKVTCEELIQESFAIPYLLLLRSMHLYILLSRSKTLNDIMLPVFKDRGYNVVQCTSCNSNHLLRLRHSLSCIMTRQGQRRSRQPQRKTQETQPQHPTGQLQGTRRTRNTRQESASSSEIQAILPGGALQTRFRVDNSKCIIHLHCSIIFIPLILAAPRAEPMTRTLAPVQESTVPESSREARTMAGGGAFMTPETSVAINPAARGVLNVSRRSALNNVQLCLPAVRPQPPSTPCNPTVTYPASPVGSSPSTPPDIRNALNEVHVTESESDDSDAETSSPLSRKQKRMQQKGVQRQTRTAANDVWSFFRMVDNERVCKLCE